MNAPAKSKTAKPHPFWRVGCWIFGHHLVVVQEFSRDSRRIVCPCCGLDKAMNDRVKLVIDWAPDVESFYRSIGHSILDPWS